MRGGYIKLYRRMTEWGWYSDPGTRAVFLHLLLTANYAPSEYMGRRIERGQVVFRYRKLADDLGIGVRVARTALERLKLTQELTLEPTRKFCVATLVNYSKYQCCEEQADTPTDTPSDTQTTHSRHTADTHSKNIRKEEEVRVPPSESSNELSSPQGAAAKVKPKKPKPQATESFATFWKAYPKKAAKPNALKAWEKIEDVDAKLGDIMAGLERAKRSQQWMKDGGQFIPYPATWLNQMRWEDEYSTTAQRSLPPGYELN